MYLFKYLCLYSFKISILSEHMTYGYEMLLLRIDVPKSREDCPWGQNLVSRGYASLNHTATQITPFGQSSINLSQTFVTSLSVLLSENRHKNIRTWYICPSVEKLLWFFIKCVIVCGRVGIIAYLCFLRKIVFAWRSWYLQSHWRCVHICVLWRRR